MTQSTNKLLVIITLIVVIIIAAGLYIWKVMPPNIPQSVAINTTNQPTIGKKDAKIQIVAFEDLKCGNCKIFNNTLLPKIKKQYIDTGIAKYTMINLAFIPGSMPIANTARCLYVQNKDYFFPFVEYVYHHQPPETKNWASISLLLQYAKEAVPQSDQKALSQCMVEGRYNQVILNNVNMARKIMNNTIATPSLYINGRIVTPLTMDRIKLLIETAQKD